MSGPQGFFDASYVPGGRLGTPWLDVRYHGFVYLAVPASTVLMAINNPVGSGRIVVVRYFRVQQVASVAGNRTIQTLRSTANATGGTTLAQRALRTTQPAASVVGLYCNAADLGALTAITPGAGAFRIERCWPGVQGDAAAASALSSDVILIRPDLPEVLEPGESIHCIVDQATAGDQATGTAIVRELLTTS